MSIALTKLGKQLVIEIADGYGRPWPYRYRIRAGKWAWGVVLTALDEEGKPVVDRRGQQRSYAVTLCGTGHWCQCLDYQLRRRLRGETCKHIRAARELKQFWDDLHGKDHEKD